MYTPSAFYMKSAVFVLSEPNESETKDELIQHFFSAGKQKSFHIIL